MSGPQKKFTLSHTIDLSKVTYEQKATETETHFSIPWCMVYLKSYDSLTIGVLCLYPKSDEWEIQTELTYRLNAPDGTILQVKAERSFKSSKDRKSLSWWWNDLAKLNRIETFYAKDGKCMIEVHVVIKKMSGFGPEKLRYFDQHTQNRWDVILSVDSHKFYLSKAFLAFQSTYFDKLLFGAFKESSQEEVELKEIDHEDFQKFLELIHGESAVNGFYKKTDTNIDGVLHLSDMFDVPTAIRRCEEFLVLQSKWSLDEKMQLAERYNLKDLMKNLEESSKEEKKEEPEDIVAKPVEKPSNVSWFSCIRKQRD